MEEMSEKRKTWLAALAAYVAAAEAFEAAWDPSEVEHLASAYPDDLPSFDEHVNDLRRWLAAEKVS